MNEKQPEFAGLRQRFHDGVEIIGTFININAPGSAELIAVAGFDVLCIDGEHGAVSMSDIENLIRATQVHGATAMARVAEVGIEISRVLDAGAAGVVVPRVESAEQAAQAVAWGRYPGDGIRGAGPGRAASYGYAMSSTFASANREVAIVVQVETRDGAQNASAIAATPGVDAVFIGPADLAVSLGVPMGGPEHSAAIADIAAAVRAQGQRLGIYVSDPAELPRYRELGITFLLIQSDASFLVARAAAVREAARRPAE